MILIEKWLNGKQNFIVGRTLYETFGKDAALKTLFSKGETAFAKQKLLSVLQALKSEPVVLREKPEISFFMPMPESDDKVLQGIAVKWKEKYQRMKYLGYRLDAFGESNAKEAISSCEKICAEILELEQECMQLWKERAEYIETGRLAEVKAKEIEIPTDPLALAKMIDQATKNIRRNRKLMREHPDKPKYAQLYNDHKMIYKKATGKDYKERENGN
jgi:chorismate mutase